MRAKAWAVCQIVHFPNGNLNAFLSNNSRGMSESERRGGDRAQRAPYAIPIGNAGCCAGLAQCAKALSYERS